MRTIISIFASILILVVFVWVAVFGGIGTLLAPRRGRTRIRGFLLGVLLGPVGWIMLLIRPGSARRILRRPSRDEISIERYRAPLNQGAEVGDDDDLPIH